MQCFEDLKNLEKCNFFSFLTNEKKQFFQRQKYLKMQVFAILKQNEKMIIFCKFKIMQNCLNLLKLKNEPKKFGQFFQRLQVIRKRNAVLAKLSILAIRIFFFLI